MKLFILMKYYENLWKVKLKISKVFVFIFVTLIKEKINKIFKKNKKQKFNSKILNHI